MVVNNYEAELNEIMQEQDEVTLIQQNDVWAIRDLNTAVWADSKIHEKEVKIAEINKIADSNIEVLEKKIEQLKQWKEDATRKDKSDIEFFKSHLHLYHMRTIEEEEAENEQLKKDGKKEKKISSTIKLPYRDLTSRKQNAEIQINGKKPDEAKTDPQLIAFVKENKPELIKEEVKWADFKKSLQEEKDGKMIYLDENGGQPLDFIKLIEKNERKYDWKLKEIKE